MCVYGREGSYVCLLCAVCLLMCYVCLLYGVCALLSTWFCLLVAYVLCMYVCLCASAVIYKLCVISMCSVSFVCVLCASVRCCMPLLCVAVVFVFCMPCVSRMCGVHAAWCGGTVSLGAPVVCVCMRMHIIVTSKEIVPLLPGGGGGGGEMSQVEVVHPNTPMALAVENACLSFLLPFPGEKSGM